MISDQEAMNGTFSFMPEDMPVGAFAISGSTVEGRFRGEKLVIEKDATFLNFADSDSVLIYGNGKFFDVLTCDEFYCEGMATLKKDLICEKAVVSGNTEIYRNLSADSVKVTGFLDARGKINTTELIVDGELKSYGNVKAEKIAVSGTIRSVASVKGLDVIFKTNDKVSNVVKLKAEKLVCDNTDRENNFAILECDDAECYLANLRCAKIDTLFCESCRLGPGTYIRRLECHNEPLISPEAVVEKIIRF